VTRTGAAAGSDLRWWATASALAAGGIAVLIWVGRGTLFSVDDLVWFMSTPDLDLEGVLEPHNGHLIATSRLVYRGVFEVFGADYAPIRVLTAVSAAGTALLLFAWMKRWLRPELALAGAALVLFLGTSYVHLIAGNGVPIQLALVTGIGALLALERGDRVGDTVACVLLCLGVFSYSIALGFPVAAAVAVILARRPDRLWVPAIPVLLYGTWWIWAQGRPDTTGEETELLNVLLAPAFGFEMLASALGSLTGLDYEFAAEQVRSEFDTTAPVAGRALALGAVIAFAWHARRARMPAAAWVALGYLVTLFVLGSLTSDAGSPPNASRFVLFTSAGILLVAAAAAGGVRWSRGGTIAVGVVAACGIATNVSLLLDGGEFRRDADAAQLRAELTGAELAGAHAVDQPDLSAVAGGSAFVNFPFTVAPPSDYVAATERYGRFGYSPGELRAGPEELRARTDAMLLALYGTSLTRYRENRLPAGCERQRASAGSPLAFELPDRGAVIETSAPAAAVRMRRFADETGTQIGVLEPRVPAEITVPSDAAPDPWYVDVDASSALICPLGGPPP
jgi:hypothetical protein